MAETAIRNDGKLEAIDWANAIGSTLSTAVTQTGKIETIDGDRRVIVGAALEDVGRRLAVNLAVGSVLSAFDKDAGRSYLENSVANEVGSLIGQEIGKGMC